MFIGHFAVGFAAKKFAPRASLAPLLAAPLFLDILWPIFILLGWEHVRVDPGNTRYTPLDLYDYPWSHSLLTSIIWATIFALIYHRITRYRAGTMIVELVMFATGIALYLQTTRPRDRIGRYAFAAYVVLLLALYIGDRFSPPPPSVASIAWPGVLASVILLPWAWWFDRHRALRETAAG